MNAISDSSDEILDIAEKMIEYGGSFAKAIGEALIHADMNNRKILIDSFSDLIMSFRRFLK